MKNYKIRKKSHVSGIYYENENIITRCLTFITVKANSKQKKKEKKNQFLTKYN